MRFSHNIHTKLPALPPKAVRNDLHLKPLGTRVGNAAASALAVSKLSHAVAASSSEHGDVVPLVELRAVVENAPFKLIAGVGPEKCIL